MTFKWNYNAWWLWCSDYHYITAWTQVLYMFKSCLWHVRDLRWWGSLTMIPAGNRAKCFSSVNYTTKQFIIIIIVIIIIMNASTKLIGGRQVPYRFPSVQWKLISISSFHRTLLTSLCVKSQLYFSQLA